MCGLIGDHCMWEQTTLVIFKKINWHTAGQDVGQWITTELTKMCSRALRSQINIDTPCDTHIDNPHTVWCFQAQRNIVCFQHIMLSYHFAPRGKSLKSVYFLNLSINVVCVCVFIGVYTVCVCVCASTTRKTLKATISVIYWASLHSFQILLGLSFFPRFVFLARLLIYRVGFLKACSPVMADNGQRLSRNVFSLVSGPV